MTIQEKLKNSSPLLGVLAFIISIIGIVISIKSCITQQENLDLLIEPRLKINVYHNLEEDKDYVYLLNDGVNTIYVTKVLFSYSNSSPMDSMRSFVPSGSMTLSPPKMTLQDNETMTVNIPKQTTMNFKRIPNDSSYYYYPPFTYVGISVLFYRLPDKKYFYKSIYKRLQYPGNYRGEYIYADVDEGMQYDNEIIKKIQSQDSIKIFK
ncbi:MAG: hypothetical protein IAE93_00415 [Ignavibacteria bacterium]|nr:hypothetical protein [Ignavibacteria bacterium]